MDTRRPSTAIRYYCYVCCWLILLTTASNAQFYYPGDGITIRKDTASAGRFSLLVDTVWVKSPLNANRNLIDSLKNAGFFGTSVDTTKFVSMNRDDATIRGEKTFLGVAAFRSFGQFTLTNGEKRAWWASHDTATKRIGDTVIETSSIGIGEQTMLLYSSGLFDLPKQSSVRAYRSGNQAVAILDTVVFNAETFDRQFEHNTTNGSFVARIAGTYLVSVHVFVNTSSTANIVQIALQRNYSAYAIAEEATYTDGVNWYASVGLTTLVQLSAGGIIKTKISFNNSGGTIQGASDATYISIIKVM